MPIDIANYEPVIFSEELGITPKILVHTITVMRNHTWVGASRASEKKCNFEAKRDSHLVLHTPRLKVKASEKLLQGKVTIPLTRAVLKDWGLKPLNYHVDGHRGI